MLVSLPYKRSSFYLGERSVPTGFKEEATLNPAASVVILGHAAPRPPGVLGERTSVPVFQEVSHRHLKLIMPAFLSLLSRVDQNLSLLSVCVSIGMSIRHVCF